MKRKKSSDYFKSTNSNYQNIFSISTKDLTSKKEMKRESSNWFKNNNIKINSYEDKSKNFPALFTSSSFYNNVDLYLNKKNYIFKNRRKKQNKYFEKELLFDRVIKLQKDLNSLSQKYIKQKIENTKQSKEIKKQNKILNMININNFIEKRNNSKSNSNIYHINIDSNSNRYDFKEIESKEKMDIPENISIEKLKEKYKKLSYDYEQVLNNMTHLEEENEMLKGNNEKIKIANETLISNLKMQCKNLEKENEIKSNELNEIKKTMKYSTFNELIKEKEIYEKEMKKMKIKMGVFLKKINNFKIMEEKINLLNDKKKKKDFKIKMLEMELKTLSNDLEKTVKNFKDKIISKDKIIKKQEREIKFKKRDDNNNTYDSYVENKNKKKELKIKILPKNKTREEIIEKNPEYFRLYIEMKQKGINSEKILINNVLKNLEEMGTLSDNKIIFIESLINLFNIEEIDDKSFIMDIADKEFVNNKSLIDIKNNIISIFETLFNKNNKVLKNHNEIKKILTSNEDIINKMKNLFEKYDKNKRGFITFNEMLEIVKETKLENIKEELLLISKSEIFNRMNYYKLILLIQGCDEPINNEENKNNI